MRDLRESGVLRTTLEHQRKDLFFCLWEAGLTLEDFRSSCLEYLPDLAYQGQLEIFSCLVTAGLSLEDLRFRQNICLQGALLGKQWSLVLLLRQVGLTSSDLEEALKDNE